MAITAKYHVDPINGSDANDGLTTSTAFATFQKAVNVSVAGDITFLRVSGGTDETITESIDISLSGDTVDGYIKFIGVNSNWEIDGSRYVIRPSSVGAFNGIIGASARVILANLDVSTFADGLDINFDSGSGLINVAARNCTGYGFDLYHCSSFNLTFCVSENNATGVSTYYSMTLLFCTIRDNAGSGIAGYPSTGRYIGCIITGNGTRAIVGAGEQLIYNCVIDDNPIGPDDLANASHVIGSRLTNCSTSAINNVSTSYGGLYLFNYFQNNGSDIVSPDLPLFLEEYFGYDTNEYNQGDTDSGYVDSVNDDFNLTEVATMRDIAITMPE